MLIKKVEEFIAKQGLLKKGDKVLVAVSGGPDSVALLDMLVRLGPKYSLQVCVAHLNHSLRKQESDADEAFVSSLSARYRVPYFSRKVDVRAFAKAANRSLEDAARQVRYQFFASLAREEHADKIAIGHNANDQVETVFLFLLRGSGRHGLAGMPVRRGRIIRPLLECWRKDIEHYTKENKLSYRIDSSNLKADCLRNRIRLNLLPEIAKNYNPQIYQHIYTLSQITAEEEAFLDQYARTAIARCVQNDQGMECLPVGRFQKYALWLKRRIIHKLSGTYSFSQIERILQLIEKKGPSRRLSLGDGRYVRKEYERLIFWQETEPERKIEKEYVLDVPGVTPVFELGIAVKAEICPRREIFSWESQGNCAYVNAAGIKGKLVLRTRRAGDLFQPFGFAKKKKLKDYFIDEKIPRSERDRVPLIVDDEKIVFVVGCGRIDERVKVTTHTKNILRVEVAELEPR